MNSFSKIKWQCRRGTLELDIMLSRYLDSAYEKAEDFEKQQFLNLLDLQDTELMTYLMGNQLPESEGLAGIVKKIRALPAN